MTWLVAHMWIALAGAALVALLLGWSLRGMMVLGRLRRAEVDRDVARVELGEAREEIERLFAAQRKLLAGQGGAQSFEAAQVSPQADPALEQQLAETLAALHAARDELDALKAAPPVLAPTPEMAALPAIDPSVLAQAQALEEKVAGLEAELVEARRALAEAEVARAEAAAVPSPAADASGDPKLNWKLGYLALRVKALENEVAAQPSLRQAAAEPADITPEETPSSAAAEEEPVEEELARLRWRNRFLEGRLAYFEGDAESVAEEIAAEENEPDAEAGAYEDAGDGEPEKEGLAEEETGSWEATETDEAEADDASEDEMDEGAYAAEAILERLEADDASAEDDMVPARPLALEGPVEDAPDDLTLIGGIGPRIQDVLNSLGIYHYDQIADWSPENIAWIDDYLNFKGRVKREGWVEQAAILVGESVEP